MTTRRAFMVLLLAWAALFVFAPTARASQTEDLLARLCPNGDFSADQVAGIAHRFLLHPAILVAVLAAESGCRMGVVGSHREVCAMQIIPGGAAATSQILGRRFSRRELLDSLTCLYVGARYLAYQFQTCGTNPRLALTGYSHRRGCKRSRYADEVLRLRESCCKRDAVVVQR